MRQKKKMQAPDNPTPVIPRGVVEHLEETFPDRCPDGVDVYTWYVEQGKLEVVRYIRRLYEQQQEG